GDFKIDAGAPEDERTDLQALSTWGDRGVLVMLSDSTNVEERGRTGAEDDLLPAFQEVFDRTQGKVMVSCFATSIPRIQRVADLARSVGRRVGFIGRRMADNAEVALELGVLRIPAADLVSAGEAGHHPPQRLCLFVAGSQGEPLSALSIVSVGEHRDVSSGPGCPPIGSCWPRTATCSSCPPPARARRPGWRPGASSSTAPGPRAWRTWSCATAATCRPKASWSR